MLFDGCPEMALGVPQAVQADAAPRMCRCHCTGDGGADCGGAGERKMTAGVSCGDRRPGDQSERKSYPFCGFRLE